MRAALLSCKKVYCVPLHMAVQAGLVAGSSLPTPSPWPSKNSVTYSAELSGWLRGAGVHGVRRAPVAGHAGDNRQGMFAPSPSMLAWLQWLAGDVHKHSCCSAHEGCLQLLTADTAHLQALCFSSTANDACELATASETATALQGLRIVDLYAKKGIEPSRLYIKAWALHAIFELYGQLTIICELYVSENLGDV